MSVTRLFQSKIYAAFENSFITLLLGPRRVGKSFLVETYFKEHPQENAVFLNMDLLEMQLAVGLGNLVPVIENRLGKKLGDLPQKFWLVIDEAQKSPALFDQVKILYDRFKDTGKFKCILTGSGSLSLLHHSSESLGGRVFSYELMPFVLEEAFRLRHGEQEIARPFSQLVQNLDLSQIEALVLSLQPKQGLLRECLQEQLIWGGFPEVLKSADTEERKTYLANYRQTYLEKDVRSLDQVGDLSAFNRLLELIAFQTGNLRQDKRLYDALGISPQTLAKYLGILEATFLYYELPPYIHTPFKRLYKAAKSYLGDNGLLSYLRGIYGIDLLEGSDAIGAWFENWVLSCLKALMTTRYSDAKFYFWKTSGNVEVDVILEFENQILPIEIKYTQRPDTKKAKHLKRFLSEEGRAKFGVMIYNGPLQYDKRDRILYFPVWALL
ncbi:MAG: ATP-binding protein [Deltaproteobacteria bacterium]|nr:ATP-binding protein [Deltaproteobacteria bacterium]